MTQIEPWKFKTYPLDLTLNLTSRQKKMLMRKARATGLGCEGYIKYLLELEIAEEQRRKESGLKPWESL